MAKIFRISGYVVDGDRWYFARNELEEALNLCVGDTIEIGGFRQLHVEEGEDFELDGEEDPKCDLALLTRHFKHVDGDNLKFDRPLPTPGEKYKHFKIGKVVTIVGIARHTETEEITVVYDYYGTLWSRPLAMFMSEVDRDKYPDAKQKYRFELVEEA